jgi:hypothetical protein
MKAGLGTVIAAWGYSVTCGLGIASTTVGLLRVFPRPVARERARPEEMCTAEDGVERCPQFVRDYGQELVFQATCALELRARRLLAVQQLRTRSQPLCAR